MAPNGTRDDELAPDIAAIERTHQLARDIGAPDLRPDPTWHLLGESKGNETNVSRGTALALVQLQENSSQLRRSLERPRVCHRGHHLTPENVYTGRKGTQCRECRNASYRKAA